MFCQRLGKEGFMRLAPGYVGCCLEQNHQKTLRLNFLIFLEERERDTSKVVAAAVVVVKAAADVAVFAVAFLA
jgi:hypothetical protein